MSAEDGCGRCSSQRGARRLHFFHDERRRREMGAAAGGTHPAAQNTTPRTKAPRAHASVKAMGCESGPSRSAICDSPMSRGACANPRRRTSDSSASTDQASRPVGDLTRETSGPPAEACLGSPPRRARARAVAAAPSGKRPKFIHHGEGARSRRLDRQGAPRVEPSLAARRRRVSPPPRYRVFISDLPRDRAAARPSFPLPPSIPSADLARVAPLASRSRRSSSASRWRSPSWSPSAATSRSCWWRRATCSR